jgi:hypothetical protein
MLRLGLAILVSSYALAQPLKIGLLIESSEGAIFVGAGQYSQGRWTRQSEPLPAQWQLWNQDLHGATLRVLSPCKVEECWITDFPRSAVRPPNPKVIGVTVSPDTAITPFESLTETSRERDKIDALLGPAMQSQLDARAAENGLDPMAGKPGNPQHVSRALIGGQTYYHVLRTTEVYDRKAATHQCQFFRFVFDAWVQALPAGAPRIVTAHSQLDDCYGADLVYFNPAGMLSLDGRTFVVGQELYYEGASAAVVRLDQSSVSLAIRHHWTAD